MCRCCCSFDAVVASEGFRSATPAALIRLLTACRASEDEVSVFKAAWTWVCSHVDHVSHIDAILGVIKVPAITISELLGLGKGAGAGVKGASNACGLAVVAAPAAVANAGGGGIAALVEALKGEEGDAQEAAEAGGHSSGGSRGVADTTPLPAGPAVVSGNGLDALNQLQAAATVQQGQGGGTQVDGPSQQTPSPIIAGGGADSAATGGAAAVPALQLLQQALSLGVAGGLGGQLGALAAAGLLNGRGVLGGAGAPNAAGAEGVVNEGGLGSALGGLMPPLGGYQLLKSGLVQHSLTAPDLSLYGGLNGLDGAAGGLGLRAGAALPGAGGNPVQMLAQLAANGGPTGMPFSLPIALGAGGRGEARWGVSPSSGEGDGEDASGGREDELQQPLAAGPRRSPPQHLENSSVSPDGGSARKVSAVVHVL